MTLHGEFKYFFSCTRHCHPHDASRLLCQPEHAAPAIHSEVVKPFFRDHIHERAPGASCSSPGSLPSTRGYLSACALPRSPRPEGAARWPWPGTARCLPGAAAWCSERSRGGAFETSRVSCESEVWKENKGPFLWTQALITIRGHSTSRNHCPPKSILSPSPPTGSLCAPGTWALLPQSSALLHSPLGQIYTGNAEGIVLTSPLPTVGSSMNWPQRACRAGAQLAAPHLSFTMLSCSDKEALILLRDNLLSACST